jgi:hypothetical protein
LSPAAPRPLAGLATALLLAIATASYAADEPATRPTATVDTFPHPVMPEPSRWPTYAFRAIGAMFFLAAVVGPIVRKSFPQDLPPATHSHDEPPGTSGHHGRSGTKDLNPPDRHHH